MSRQLEAHDTELSLALPKDRDFTKLLSLMQRYTKQTPSICHICIIHA